jgi:hypothetical protein
MATLALEMINGIPLLVAKGQRCEVYRVVPDLNDNAFQPSRQWVVENGGLCLPHPGLPL